MPEYSHLRVPPLVPNSMPRVACAWMPPLQHTRSLLWSMSTELSYWLGEGEGASLGVDGHWIWCKQYPTEHALQTYFRTASANLLRKHSWYCSRSPPTPVPENYDHHALVVPTRRQRALYHTMTRKRSAVSTILFLFHGSFYVTRLARVPAGAWVKLVWVRQGSCRNSIESLLNTLVGKSEWLGDPPLLSPPLVPSDRLLPIAWHWFRERLAPHSAIPCLCA